MLGVKKARAIGFNLIALEVNDIDEALAFYGSLFDFKLRGRVRIQPSLTSAISSCAPEGTNPSCGRQSAFRTCG